MFRSPDVRAKPAARSKSQGDTRQRVRAVRDMAKQGQEAIPKIAPVPARHRYQASAWKRSRRWTKSAGPRRSTRWCEAARDNDPEMQIRATDGLVNVYLPGYLKTGLSGSLKRAGTSIKAKFTDTNDQMIDPYVEVPPAGD